MSDSVGFCWDAHDMGTLSDWLHAHDGDTLPRTSIVAGISPHDDYLYAARVYAPLYSLLQAKEIVIFGVTHRTVRQEVGDFRNVLLFDSYDRWIGPRGPVPVSPLREALISQLDPSHFLVHNRAQAREHSIEALIPFLQEHIPDVRIVPIMVTAMEIPRMDTLSRELGEILGRYIRERHLIPGVDIAFLISSDANHYGADFGNVPFGVDARAHSTATSQDRTIAASFLTGAISLDKLRGFSDAMQRVVWCGRYSIPFGLLTADRALRAATGKGMTGRILRYSDSWTEGVLPLRDTAMGTTAPFSLHHWVGFLSAAYETDTR